MVLSKGQCNTYKNGIEIMDSCACMCAYSVFWFSVRESGKHIHPLLNLNGTKTECIHLSGSDQIHPFWAHFRYKYIFFIFHLPSFPLLESDKKMLYLFLVKQKNHSRSCFRRLTANERQYFLVLFFFRVERWACPSICHFSELTWNKV